MRFVEYQFDLPSGVSQASAVSGSGATGNRTTWIADVGGAPHFNAQRSFAYNNVGQVLTAADPLGTVTQSGYDKFWQPDLDHSRHRRWPPQSTHHD
jgi:hypothetical protein